MFASFLSTVIYPIEDGLVVVLSSTTSHFSWARCATIYIPLINGDLCPLVGLLSMASLCGCCSPSCGGELLQLSFQLASQHINFRNYLSTNLYFIINYICMYVINIQLYL